MEISAEDYTRAATEFFARATGFDEFAMRAGLQLVRAANSFEQISAHRVHRPRGLSWTGFSILFTLRLFGPLEARTLARVAGVTKQAVSLALAGLERDELVQRVKSDVADRRLIAIELTDKGRETALRAGDAQNELVGAWFGRLDSEELRTLVGLLERLLADSTAPDS